MYPVMNSASKVNGILFCLVLAGMFVYSLPPVFSFAKNQSDAWNLFVDGKLLRKFEQAYDKRFFLREPSVQLWADAQYLLFREGTKGVVLGKDGWLYTSQEYRVPNDLEANLQGQLAQIDAVQAQLAQHGKRLVLLPLPMKLDIYAAHAEHPFDPRAISLYDRFVAQLQARNVTVTPLRSAFLDNLGGPPLFLKSDTHWSPDGARLAAFELARTRPQVRLLSLHPGTVVSGLSQPFRGAYSARPADVAAAQLLTLIDQLTPADSGHFFAYDGERLPW